MEIGRINFNNHESAEYYDRETIEKLIKPKNDIPEKNSPEEIWGGKDKKYYRFELNRDTIWITTDKVVNEIVNKYFIEVYGDYDMCVFESLSPDTYQLYDVNGDRRLDVYDIDLSRNIKFYNNISVVLDLLARRGLLPFNCAKLLIHIKGENK